REIQRIEEKVVVDQLRVRAHVERLDREEAAVRARGDVADAVRAGAARRDADLVQLLVDRAHVLERRPVALGGVAVGGGGEAAAGRSGAASRLTDLPVARIIRAPPRPCRIARRRRLRYAKDLSWPDLPSQGEGPWLG